MKISNETRELLNFASTINKGFYFNNGSAQVQESQNKNQLLIMELKEEIPSSFFLPDLRRLNALLGKSKDTEVYFNTEDCISIQEGRRFEYRLEIQKNEGKEIREPKSTDKWRWDLENIFISKRTLSTIIEFSRQKGVCAGENKENVEFFSQDNRIMMFVGPDLNKRNDGLMVAIGEGWLDSRLQINAGKLPTIKDDYSVDISSKGIIRFRNDRYKIRHYFTSRKY